jgi:hypothetical protein
MKVIVIDSRSLTRLAARVLPAAILLFGFGSTVDAAGPSFAAGEVLSAAKMNAHFGEIDARASKLESRLTNGGRYAISGVYVKPSLASTKGDLAGLGVPRGYGGARTACQSAVGTQTAHVCTPPEILASVSLGIAIPEGWYATAVSNVAGSYLNNDCYGFTNTAGNGVAWTNGASGSYPHYVGCEEEKPLLCCDMPP